MNLGLIINCMGQTEQTVNDLQTKYLKSIEPELQKIGFDVISIFPTSDWLHAQIKSHDGFSFHQDSKEIQERMKSNNKGIVVSECLSRFREQKIEIVLHIDGSKAFNLESIIDVAKNFLEASIGAVLTVRKNNTGMSKPRELVEEFERFLIHKKYGIDIEDGQSGCWAFRDNSSIHITARGYEIEIDVLTELINLNVNIVWFPVQLNTREPSQFAYLPSSMEKIKFICNKLKISKFLILSILEEFARLNIKKIQEIDMDESSNGGKNLFSEYEAEIKKIEFNT